MKKLITAIIGIASMLICFTAINASAATMEMYINEQYVERDIVNQGGIDMLPIADIAGELGFEYQQTYNGFKLKGYYNTYTFTMGNASVYDYWGNWIGLDMVPRIINDKIRIPATFVTKTLGYSYTWDYVTNIIFVNSPNSLAETKSNYWYAGWKRAADGTVENYWHSIVPDYGNLSGEQPWEYFLGEDGITYFFYDYYGEDFERYIKYLYDTGWTEIDEAFYEDNTIGYGFYKGDVWVAVAIYDNTYAIVCYMD